jgi:hypothetical protein
VERTALIVGAVLFASGLLHLGILIVSGGSWIGPLSLRKPATFGLSFGITLLTIAWVSSFLRLGDKARAMLLGTFTVACVVETALVSLQAWRGVPSHFNMETPFDAVVTRVLAGGGFTLVAIILALTFAAFRSNPAVPRSMRAAVRVGFVALTCSLLVGALMIARGMTLVFAGDPQAAYATGGAFKPAHAVTMHAILVLPMLAWLLSRTSWDEGRQYRTILIASGSYAAAAGSVVAGNVGGNELGQMPAAAVLAAAGGLALLSAGGAAVAAMVRSANR